MRRHKYALSFRSTLYRHLNIAHQLSIQSHCLTIHSNAVRPLEFFHYRIHFSHNIFAVGLHSADSYHWIWYRWAAPTPATSLTLAAMLPPPLIYFGLRNYIKQMARFHFTLQPGLHRRQSSADLNFFNKPLLRDSQGYTLVLSSKLALVWQI